MSTSPPTVEVEQIDREMAADVHLLFAGGANISPFDYRGVRAIRDGLNDHWPIVQAFRRHRIAAFKAGERNGLERAANEAIEADPPLRMGAHNAYGFGLGKSAAENAIRALIEDTPNE